MSTPSTNSDQKTICISEEDNGQRSTHSQFPAAEEEDIMCTINCLLVGDSSAEKTNLVHAYLEQFFPGQHHTPCLFFEHTLNITVKGATINLKIWDLTGQKCYDKLRQLAYKQIGFDVILICFSIVDPDSFESVKQIWAPEIKWNCPNRPFFLVGTQFDLRTDKGTFERLEIEGKLPVTRLEGNRVAKLLKAQKYFECSVTRKQGIQECFSEAIAAGLKNRQKRMKNGERIVNTTSNRNESNCSIQ